MKTDVAWSIWSGLKLMIISCALGFLLGDRFGVSARYKNKMRDLAYEALEQTRECQETMDRYLERAK